MKKDIQNLVDIQNALIKKIKTIEKSTMDNNTSQNILEDFLEENALTLTPEDCHTLALLFLDDKKEGLQKLALDLINKALSSKIDFELQLNLYRLALSTCISLSLNSENFLKQAKINFESAMEEKDASKKINYLTGAIEFIKVFINKIPHISGYIEKDTPKTFCFKFLEKIIFHASQLSNKTEKNTILTLANKEKRKLNSVAFFLNTEIDFKCIKNLMETLNSYKYHH